MDSTGFHVAVKNFTNLTPEEGDEIRKLSNQYPYSQILQLLYARAARDFNYENQVALLHQSAVYSTDRSVLKSIMQAPRRERIQEPDGVVAKVVVPDKPVKTEDPVLIQATPQVKLPETIVVASPPAKIEKQFEGSLLTGDALRDDLIHELEKLQQLKHDFEVSFDEFQRSNPARDDSKGKSKAIKDPATDPLLEEIRTTKKKLKADNPKLKEQNEIIDQFIKTQPIIPKAKPTVPQDDLSEDSGMFSDNIVSETLVEILLKQGKKDKAIEVLKKLIWKFPQKKAYFAAQIEDLKN